MVPELNVHGVGLEALELLSSSQDCFWRTSNRSAYIESSGTPLRETSHNVVQLSGRFGRLGSSS